MRKRKSIVLAIIVLAFVYISYVGIRYSEFGARKYLYSNRETIEEFALFCLAGGGETKYHGWKVDCYKENGQVVFLVSAFGIGSSSLYKGIYYSDSNMPLGFQGENINFIPYEEGWKWEEADGDNWQYTERIFEKWFWFEAHF